MKKTRQKTSWTVVLGACALALAAGQVQAQVQTQVPEVVAGAAKARMETIKVKSREIAGNLLGTPAERDVIVILPPSYDKQRSRRYPVVYALHGYSIGPDQWVKEIHLPQTAEGAFAKGTPEMIIVLPSSKNEHNGAFYSNSITTGNFENFIADELIEHIDRNYRTLARPESRGLVGHSMGGYGASRIGVRRAELYGALYLMAPCCQSPQTRSLTVEQVAQLEALPSVQAAASLPFGLRGTLALASAWSPNPNKPPLFIDLPVDSAGKERPEILAKWTANATLAFLDQYITKVRGYKAIAMDVGDKDSLVTDTRRLHEALKAQGIPSTFEVYPGDHTSHVAFRFQDHVLPFFGRNLSFRQGK
ncbi:MAG: alpha/beta hydrolase-fold protein [Pseudomonadota bacterium]|nr:alpha/beta hydrolase-fold protein [Pseudomonadota bacterium]